MLILVFAVSKFIIFHTYFDCFGAKWNFFPFILALKRIFQYPNLFRFHEMENSKVIVFKKRSMATNKKIFNFGIF